MDARKTVPTVVVCSRSDRENREDCPPTHFICIFVFLIILFIFVIFCHVLC